MNIRVLLVEDNPADARLIREQLREAGAVQFQLDHVDRLESGLKRASAESYDVMLLDLSLPDTQGLDTLVRVREGAPAMPVVVLTGFDDEALATGALREGAQDYLVKGQADAQALVRSMRYAIERSRSEQALRESEERYRFLFENNPHPMWVFDADTLAFLAVNNAAVNHYGYSRDEFLGMSIVDIRPPGDVPALLRDLRRDQDNVRSAGNWRHRKKDGSLINVELSTYPLNFGGRPARLVLANDVTERVRLEEQFRQSQKMEAIGRLAGGVAHDFNNLLTVITGYGQMILSRLSPTDASHGDMEEVLNAANRAAVLTSQLLAFSRRRMAESRVFDLNTVVSGMEKMLRRLIGEDVRLETALDRSVRPIKADPGQVEQIIMNLVVNARDAMPGGGKITIRTDEVELSDDYARAHIGVRSGRYVMLAVSDTGRGMNEEVRRHIFEPFFTTKDPGKGTGLGLSTVYGIVKQSGGDIWVDSQPDKGTTFKLYFPFADDLHDAEPARARRQEPRGVETILLVEDDPEVRGMVRRILVYQGYQVLEASSGPEAIELAGGQGGPIHLLLTDMVLEEMGGRVLAEALAPARPDMKVLFMSGYTDAEVPDIGEMAPGTQFIQKPFLPDALVRKVREVLDTPMRNSAC